MMEVAALLVVLCVVAFGVWGLYVLLKAADREKGDRIEAPYKLETPNDVAVYDRCPDNSYFRPDHFEPYCKPKRNYTKRSKYWNTRKAKAKKARRTQNRKLK